MAGIRPLAQRAQNSCPAWNTLGFKQTRNQSISHKSNSSKSQTSLQNTKSWAKPSTLQAGKLRSIVSLYHASENFAPVKNNNRLVRFIDDSLLFKKQRPTPYTQPHNPNVLVSTINLLTLNKPILRPGENEQDLNPITSAHRIRAGNQRWQKLKDALCGTSSSDLAYYESARTSRFASKFGATLDWSGSTRSDKPKSSKPSLEIIEENWDIIQEMNNNKTK